MKHRFLIAELQGPKQKSDLEILRILVNERMNSVGNANAPLYQRLSKLGNKLDKVISLNDGSILNDPTKESVTF